MAISKFFRFGSFLLVLLSFLSSANRSEPDFLGDLLLYNAVPLAFLISSIYALKGEDLRTRISFELALFFWFAGSVISSLTAVYLFKTDLQLVSKFLYLLFYPLIFIAIPRLLNSSVSSTFLENIDAAIVALGVSALASALLMKPVLPNFNGDQLETFFAIIFPNVVNTFFYHSIDIGHYILLYNKIYYIIYPTTSGIVDYKRNCFNWSDYKRNCPIIWINHKML